MTDRMDRAFTPRDLVDLGERGITFGVELAGPDAGSYWAMGPRGMTGKGRTPRLAVEDLFRARGTRVSRCSTCQDSYAAGVKTCPMCSGPMGQFDVPAVGDDEDLAAA